MSAIKSPFRGVGVVTDACANRCRLLLMWFWVLILANAALATELEPGKEYCGDDYPDLLLSPGACVIQGYLNEIHYSEESDRHLSVELTYKGQTLQSIRLGYAIALDGQIVSAWLLSQSAAPRNSLIQVIYKPREPPSTGLQLLELGFVIARKGDL